MCPFLGFTWLGQTFHRENRKPKNLPSPSPSPSPIPFPFLSLSHFSLHTHFLNFLPHISYFFPSLPFWVSVFYSFSSMKKMKGAASQYPSVFEDSNARFKHHTLLQDFNQLEKETETAKRKLQMMKQKKMTLITEVRFLRKRYEYLMKNKSLNDHQSIGNPVQPEQFNNRAANNTTKKGKSGSRRRPAFPTISDVIQKERIDRAIDIPLQNSTPIPVLDLNQKAKTCRKKTNRQRNSTPVLDLNQKERMYSGRDANASQRTITPFFDLNQISVEEEEMQTHYEPLRADELKKSFLRGDGNDEQQNDINISACRTVGDGPSRAGKRKISWQDQVALRV